MSMRRIIVDYKKLNASLLDRLVEAYPEGYDDADKVRFQNAKGEWVDCIEVKTEDTVYLVKVGKRLIKAMEEYDEDEAVEDEVDMGDPDGFEDE